MGASEEEEDEDEVKDAANAANNLIQRTASIVENFNEESKLPLDDQIIQTDNTRMIVDSTAAQTENGGRFSAHDAVIKKGSHRF